MISFVSIPDGSEKLNDNSPGAASISSIDIANEFAGLSYEEQDRLRSEWSQVIESYWFCAKMKLINLVKVTDDLITYSYVNNVW